MSVFYTLQNSLLSPLTTTSQNLWQILCEIWSSFASQLKWSVLKICFEVHVETFSSKGGLLISHIIIKIALEDMISVLWSMATC